MMTGLGTYPHSIFMCQIKLIKSPFNPPPNAFQSNSQQPDYPYCLDWLTNSDESCMTYLDKTSILSYATAHTHAIKQNYSD